jgi:hypothetical protein
MYFLLQRIPRGLDPLRSIMEKVYPLAWSRLFTF